ncbi:MAG: Ethyl tert-butyl ether degradation EthD [Gemmatimonadetes bacterium]|nr:Ethyl tert-butyl ether degradation EthD [Gemmatimonadota bacterium]
MIKLSVLYPNSDGASFDIDYYRAKHLPLIQQRCAGACTRVAIDEGLGGIAPGSPAPYIVIGHLYFDSLDSMQTSFGPHMAEAVADIPNFTNVQPTIQISEVVM